MAENGDLWLNQMGETQRVRHGSPLDNSWKVASLLCKSHGLTLLVIEIHAIKVLPRIHLDLEKNGWKWRFSAWLRVKWRSYGVPMIYNDELSQALSNGENRISSFLLVASIHGSVRFGACIHKWWEKWLKMASFSMVWSQMEELGRQIKIND